MRALTLLAATASLGVAGCFELKAAYVIEKDGSGTVSLRTVVNRATTAAVERFYETNFGGGAAEGGTTEMPAKALFDSWAKSDEIRKRLLGKKGVELVSAAQTEDRERGTLTVESHVKFESLEAYYRSGVEPHLEAELARGGDGAWTLRRTILPPDHGLEERRAKKVRDTIKGYAPVLAKFFEKVAIDVSVAFPTPVVATSGVRSADGNGVAWHLGFADATANPPPTSTVTLAGEGLAWRPFHLRIDLNGTVTDLPPGPEKPAPAPPVDAPTAPAKPPDSPPTK